MSLADRERWDEKHAREEEPSREPAASLSWIPAAPREGALALDLACGSGRHVAVLVERGYRVIATDVSLVPLRRIRRAPPSPASVVTVQADVDAWVFAENAFDLLIQVNFLDRPALAAIKRSVRPGGCILIDTFCGSATRAVPGPTNPRYRLAFGELATAFRTWTILRLAETRGPDSRAAILARRPGTPA